ncbi:MAG: hypothetical protein LBS60_14215 [Deltaproteobacteria bacterium]|jgi:hypothetical protein|nr:hypothetical protein [Deltaproteobacteria bacterium]
MSNQNLFIWACIATLVGFGYLSFLAWLKRRQDKKEQLSSVSKPKDTL